ncbi:MAG: hypothetical protein KAT17_09975 [Candidatus Aminicenantes bacterium]|nr:hypothetical protein [Candidatus Aminicenantes bacterium]
MIKGKNVLPVLLIIIFLTFPIFTQEMDKTPVKRKFLTLTIKGDYMSITDPIFEDQYNSEKYAPEGEIQVRISGNLYLWGSYALVTARREWFEWSSKALVNPDFQWENTLKKHHYSLGAGYFIGLSEPGEFCINFQLGISFITNNDLSEKYQISSQTISDSISEKETDIGVTGELGISYCFWRNLFAEISIGYLYATEIIEENREEIGGLRIGLGLGIRF